MTVNARAIYLRQEEGLAIRAIAQTLGLPVSTVGEMVQGVDPYPHALLIDSPGDPDHERQARLRATCSACQRIKPWTEFWAAARWPDGPMRRPQSWCKECVKAARRRRRRENPEWAREQDRREWQRIKADPEKLAKRRELMRENGRVHRLRHTAH